MMKSNVQKWISLIKWLENEFCKQLENLINENEVKIFKKDTLCWYGTPKESGE